MNMNLPYPVRFALNGLRRAGYQAYCVGGCVRDTLLGETPNDFDITTSALPDEVLTLFKREHMLTVGLKHGTVTLIKRGMPIEITTFRIDGEYEDNRRPEEVTYTTHLEEDVLRRDFTVNALCWNEEEDVVDYAGGLQDLKNRLIRCVGEPDKRFNEDALRILRGLRFSSKLDFDIDPPTAAAILRNCQLLQNIAVERVATELYKLLCGRRVERILVEFRPVFEVIIPALSSLGAEEYLTAARRSALVSPVPELRLAALLCDLPVDTLHETALRLKLSKKGRAFMETLVEHSAGSLPATRPDMRRLLGQVGEDALPAVVELMGARAMALCHLVIQQRDCVRLAQLSVSGQDLMRAGVVRRQIGETLNRLLEMVIEGELPNQKEALLAVVRREVEERVSQAPAPKKRRRARGKKPSGGEPAADNPPSPAPQEAEAHGPDDTAL